jgi:hypothetical protein
MPILTEQLRIKVSKACEPVVYLRWENDYGGIDYYAFTGNIIDMPQVSKQVYFDRQIDELLNEISNFETVSKEYDENLRAHATFTKVNAEGMKQLLRSRKIEMYHDSKWWRVDVQGESFQNERNKLLGRMRIKVILNRKYIK